MPALHKMNAYREGRIRLCLKLLNKFKLNVEVGRGILKNFKLICIVSDSALCFTWSSNRTLFPQKLHALQNVVDH
jgi:hypothetical protein